ncbi:MAG: deoxyribonuclease IV [Patescibacteria group bacterium]|jgi:deoxyribonuclease-4|nr:deoxyribonuclease IV [Patescibacteria group bacterium]
MKIGIHVSTSGGIDQAVDRAAELGCNTFQIFVSNPRGWKPTVLDESGIQLFKDKYQAAEMTGAVSHSIYLINLASPKEYLRKLSIDSLVTSLENTGRLGLSGLVTHIGSHQGDGLEMGLDRVCEAIEKILDGNTVTTTTPLLLENTAGAGNLVGKNFAELGEILKRVNSKHLGVCLDTAHAFEYGYEIHTKEGLEKLIKEIDQTIGLDKLQVIHLNDSMTDLSSNRDRHEDFGEGFIGKKAMIRIINYPALKNIPFIMETPKLKSGEAGKEFIDEIKSYAK